MTSASVKTSTSTVRFQGYLKDAPELWYGEAKNRTPEEFFLTVTKADYQDGTEVFAITLRLDAPGDYPNVSFSGYFGYPHSGHMPDYERLHGRAAEGLISDLPAEILAAISEATGIDITSL